jgi:hypothetical protein
MHHHFNPSNNWTDTWTAIGTLLAVLTTVFFFLYERIRNYWNRPILKIGINFKPPECHKTTALSNQRLFPVFWFRLFVTNSGRTNSTNLELIIEKVEKMVDGKWTIYPEFLLSNLVWTHINEANLKNLLPGTTKNVDFGYILDPSGRASNPAERNLQHTISMTDNVFRVNISIQPFNAYNIIEPGDYLFHLIAGASNSKASRGKFHLSFKKDWTQDETKMLSEIVSIKKVK